MTEDTTWRKHTVYNSSPTPVTEPELLLTLQKAELWQTFLQTCSVMALVRYGSWHIWH